MTNRPWFNKLATAAGRRCLALVIGVFLPMCAAQAAAFSPADVPTPLKSWVPWVMQGHEMLSCPRREAQESAAVCVWPSRLELKASGGGASFRFEVTVYGAAAAVELPGEAEHWPQQVAADGKPQPVTSRDDRPLVYLAPGSHVVTGSLPWPEMPQSLQLPPSVGLLRVEIDGAAAVADLERTGRLWLRRGRQDEADAGSDALQIRSFRLVDDSVPMRVATRYTLVVSGKPREIELDAALLPGFIAESLDSPLPARLDESGKLRLQLRAGTWSIVVQGYRLAVVKALSLPEQAASDEEIWSLLLHGDVRLVRVQGPSTVDPQQADVPEAWRGYPAYRMRRGETLSFNEIRRGAAPPPPDKLSLERTLWLDFRGGGFTVRDRIGGVVNSSWRMELSAPGELGQVSLAGLPQPVTRLTPTSPTGVEVRQGTARIDAVSRIDKAAWTLPASGWLADFDRLSATLELPPGWTLLHVRGADSVSSSWVANWTLWDFFFVLLSALAAGKLLGWRVGALLGSALLLCWQLDGAPRLIWLALLALLALTRAVPPAAALHRVISAARGLCVVFLMLQLAAFGVEQVRLAWHPNLGAEPWSVFSARRLPSFTAGEAPADARDEAEQAAAAPLAAAPAPSSDLLSKRARVAKALPEPSASVQRLDLVDPDAKVQTGPGLPLWNWQSHVLGWKGPVLRDQSIGLVMLPPAGTALLRLSGLALALLSLAVLLGFRPRLPRFGRGAAMLLLAIGAALAAPDDARATTPPPGPAPAEGLPSSQSTATLMPPTVDAALLDELRRRLTHPEDCSPACAGLPRLQISAEGSRLTLRLEVHAQATTLIPLPDLSGPRRPDAVLLEGKPAVVRRDESGALWMAVSPGVWQVLLAADIGAADSVQLLMPLAPRRIELNSADWTLQGLDARGQAGGALSLVRKVAQQQATRTGGSAQNALPVFVRIERALRLGIHWTVQTTVARSVAGGAPVLVKVPLLDGESVTDAAVRVEQGQALINLSGDQPISFESSLKEMPAFRLKSPADSRQLEVWSLDAGPQWHVRLGGIAATQLQSAGLWKPSWQPWPGDEVSVEVSRPAGVPGQTLTIDESEITVEPGQRATDVSAALKLRSSQGTDHVFDLPAEAQLQSVRIDGQEQRLQADKGKLSVPIVPGAHRLVIAWREARGMDARFTTPSLKLAALGANDRLVLRVPQDRVVLALGGPAMGPAVLFWGFLAVLALGAWVLGRTRVTPLGGWSWFFLGLGFAQHSVAMVAVVFGLFFALAARRRQSASMRPRLFNLIQVGLVLWVVVAAVCLFNALSQSLLGLPDLMIAGNGSNAAELRWYSDRIDNATATAWVLSIPTWAYRAAVLAWALWLAASLLKWLPWGWSCISAGGGWRRRAPAPAAEAASE